ncbi:cytochrome P450, partial [Leucogyrophana mollusca]
METPTLAIALTLLTLFGLAVLAYPDHFIGTKARPDLPGPRGIPLLGNILQILPHRRRMLQCLSELERHYGELFTFTMPGRGRTIVVNRPEWLEHMRTNDGTKYSKGSTVLAVFKEFPGARGAFGSEGQLWKHSRRIMQPVFMSLSFYRHVTRALDEIIPVLQTFLHNAAESGVAFDFNEFRGKYALEVLCKATINLDTSVLTSDPGCLSENHQMMHTVSVLNRISSGRFHNPLWRLTEMLDGSRAAFHSARQDLFAVVEKLIRDRKATADLDGDFLSALLSNPSITEPVLRDTLITLLFAGRDMTQNALAWSLYELARC